MLLVPLSQRIVAEDYISLINFQFMIVTKKDNFVLHVVGISLAFNQFPQVSVAMVAKDKVLLSIQSLHNIPHLVKFTGTGKCEVS